MGVLRQVPHEDIFNLGAFAVASNFFYWSRFEMMYVFLGNNIKSSLIHLHGFQLPVLCRVEKLFVLFLPTDESYLSKGKF